MKKYLKIFALAYIIFSSDLIADCLTIPCVVGDYTYSESFWGGTLKATANNNDKLISSANIFSSRTDLLNNIKKLDEIIKRLNDSINLNDIYLLDGIAFNDNKKVVLQDLDLPKNLAITASNLTLNNIKVNGDNFELGSSYIPSRHIINNLTGEIAIFYSMSRKLGVDLTTDINNSNFSISNRFYISNNNLTIKNSEINIKGSNNIITNDQTNINTINSKLFITNLTNQNYLNIKLNQQSIMDIFFGNYANHKHTNIELDNSAFLQYEQVGIANITNIKLANHSLLAGTYNIENLEANNSVFGIGATKNTYIGAIKANIASGSNNAFWLMGTNLDANKNLVTINVNDSLINLPLMVLKGAKANYTNFINGVIVGEKGWTNSYIKDFYKYIKIYDVSNNNGDAYTIYKLNINDGVSYVGGDFSVDANGDLSFNNTIYENNTDNSDIIVDDLNISISDRQSNIANIVLEGNFNNGFKNKLQYTPLTLPTFNKIKPEVIKVASDYAKFYNFAIRNDDFTNIHKLNKDGVWLDTRTNFANNARKNILKIGAGRLKENNQSDYYLGAFAEFSQSNLNKIGAKIKKFGAGIYGGGLLLNGAFVNYDAKIFNIKNYINNDILKELNSNKIGFNVNYEIGCLFSFNDFLISPSIQQFITFSPNFMLLNANGKIDIKQKILFSNKLNTSLEYSFNEYLDLALNFGYAFDLNSSHDFIISSNDDKVKLRKDEKWNYFYTKFKSRTNINEKFMIDFEYGKNFGKKYQSGYTLGTTFKYIF